MNISEDRRARDDDELRRFAFERDMEVVVAGATLVHRRDRARIGARRELAEVPDGPLLADLLILRQRHCGSDQHRDGNNERGDHWSLLRNLFGIVTSVQKSPAVTQCSSSATNDGVGIIGCRLSSAIDGQRGRMAV